MVFTIVIRIIFIYFRLEFFHIWKSLKYWVTITLPWFLWKLALLTHSHSGSLNSHKSLEPWGSISTFMSPHICLLPYHVCIQENCCLFWMPKQNNILGNFSFRIVTIWSLMCGSHCKYQHTCQMYDTMYICTLKKMYSD